MVHQIKHLGSIIPRQKQNKAAKHLLIFYELVLPTMKEQAIGDHGNAHTPRQCEANRAAQHKDLCSMRYQAENNMHWKRPEKKMP